MRRRIPFHSNAVWPPPFIVFLFVLTYGIFYGGMWLILYCSGARSDLDTESMLGTSFVILGAVSFALFRLTRFHPAFHPRYAAWLRSSPWTWNRPLPLGPILLVWQDVFVIAVLAGVAWCVHATAAFVPITFGLSYLIGLNIAMAVTRTWLPCLLMAFLWPALFLTQDKDFPTGCIVAGLVIVAWAGTRFSLRTFPWSRNELESMRDSAPNLAKSLASAEIRLPGSEKSVWAQVSNLGWPFNALSPKAKYYSIPRLASISLSLLLGWWVYCVTVAFESSIVPAAILFFAIFAAFIRLVLYCNGLRTPFNIWGRLATGRLIIPGFDRVFVTPLTAIGIAIAGGVVISHFDPSSPAIGAGLLALILYILLEGGPTMREWRLTGSHEHRPPTLREINRRAFRSG